MIRSRFATFILISLLVGFLLATLTVTNAQEAGLSYRESMGKVLILNGFHYGLPLPDATTAAVYNGLRSYGYPIEKMMVVHLDLSRNHGYTHRQAKQLMLESMDQQHEIDLIIAMDWAAVEFLAHEGARISPQTPMISLYHEEPDWLHEPRPLITIASANDSMGTVGYALELFPDTEHAVIIMGAGDEQAPFMTEILRAIHLQAPHVSVETTAEMKYEEMILHIASLPDKTLGFYGSYFKDVDGQVFTPATVAETVSQAANAPVFGFLGMQIRQGLVGGSVVVSSELGKQVAGVAMDYLTGALAIDQNIRYEAVFHPLFDWEQLKRWQADPEKLPEETIFLNYTPTLWEEYRQVIVITFAVMGILLALVILLWFMNRKQKSTLVRLNEATESLEYSRNKLASIIEGTDVGTWEYNVESDALEINERWVEMIGYTLEELKPFTMETWKNLVHPDDFPSVYEELQKLFRRERSFYVVEFRMKHRSGDWVWVQSQGKVISWSPDREPLIVSGMHLDITNRKNSEEMLVKTNLELQKAKEDAEMASRAKSQFLSNMSHELRTPLNGLMGMNQLLQMTETSEEQDEYLKYSIDACKSLTQVVEDVLNYISLEKYRQPLDQSVFSPDELLKEIAGVYQIAARQKNLMLKIYVSPHVPGEVTGDRTKIKQLMGNLVGNALKFTQEGTVALNLDAEPSVNPEQIRLFWQVSDSGIGIEAEKIKTIFDQFNMADNSDTRQYGGMGLGLTTALELARVMGGELQVESEPDKGSCFTFICDMDLPQYTQGTS